MPCRPRRTLAAKSKGKPKSRTLCVHCAPDDTFARATAYLTRASQKRLELTTEAQNHQAKMVSALMLEVKRDEEKKRNPTSALYRELEAMVAETPDPFVHGRTAVELMKQRLAITAEAREHLAIEVARRDAAYKAWWKKTRKEQKERRRALKAEQIQRRMEVLRKVEEEQSTRAAESVSMERTPPVDAHEPRYCYCNDIAYGRMVGCDNSSCRLEWFHFNCVGLEDAPVDEWYCQYCVPPESVVNAATSVVKRSRGRPRKDGKIRLTDGELILPKSESETSLKVKVSQFETDKLLFPKKSPKIFKTMKDVQSFEQSKPEADSTASPQRQTRSSAAHCESVKLTKKNSNSSFQLSGSKKVASPQRNPTDIFIPVPETTIKVFPQTVAKSKLRTSALHCL